MQFKKYNKIHALHKAECAEMLHGPVHVQEKIDGANASIWLHEDGTIRCGSRNNDLIEKNNPFNGFVEYVQNHEGINKYMQDNPRMRLYGEWLVRHTIGYAESSYKEFYLFDIENPMGAMLEIEDIYKIAEKYGIKTAHYHGLFKNMTLEQVEELAGQSVLGEKGEGIVIKPVDFVNQFGDRTYAKYVTKNFKEDNGVTFGGNNKYSDTYLEMKYVNRYVTLPRVKKVAQKIEATLEGPRGLEMRHIPRVMDSVFHDVMTEEGHAMAKELASSGLIFNFKSFKRICDKKAKSIYQEILTGDISVANSPQGE